MVDAHLGGVLFPLIIEFDHAFFKCLSRVALGEASLHLVIETLLFVLIVDTLDPVFYFISREKGEVMERKKAG